MNEKEVIMFLRNSKREIPDRAVERCIDSLPDIKKTNSLLPLIKIQICSMPVRVYITAVAAVIFQIFLAVNVRPEEVLFPTGISSALVAMLFGWHLLLSCAGSMTEIEKTCKYSYGQILFARILCVGALTLITMLVAMVPNAGISQIGIPFLLAAVLPTVLGASVALLSVDFMGISNLSQMSVYMVTAMITSLLLEFIIELSIFFLVVIVLAANMLLFIQTKNLMNRRIYYEAYND